MDELDTDECATVLSKTLDRHQAEFYLQIAKSNRTKSRLLRIYAALITTVSFALMYVLALPHAAIDTGFLKTTGTIQILIMFTPLIVLAVYLTISAERLGHRSARQVEIFKRALRKINDASLRFG